MSDKRTEFLKHKIYEKLDYMKDGLGDTRYKLYKQIVEACDDFEELRSIAEMELQIDMYEYVKSEIQPLVENEAGEHVRTSNIGTYVRLNMDKSDETSKKPIEYTDKQVVDKMQDSDLDFGSLQDDVYDPDLDKCMAMQLSVMLENMPYEELHREELMDDLLSQGEPDDLDRMIEEEESLTASLPDEQDEPEESDADTLDFSDEELEDFGDESDDEGDSSEESDDESDEESDYFSDGELAEFGDESDESADESDESSEDTLGFSDEELEDFGDESDEPDEESGDALGFSDEELDDLGEDLDLPYELEDSLADEDDITVISVDGIEDEEPEDESSNDLDISDDELDDYGDFSDSSEESDESEGFSDEELDDLGVFTSDEVEYLEDDESEEPEDESEGFSDEDLDELGGFDDESEGEPEGESEGFEDFSDEDLDELGGFDDESEQSDESEQDSESEGFSDEDLEELGGFDDESEDEYDKHSEDNDGLDFSDDDLDDLGDYLDDEPKKEPKTPNKEATSSKINNKSQKQTIGQQEKNEPINKVFVDGTARGNRTQNLMNRILKFGSKTSKVVSSASKKTTSIIKNKAISSPMLNIPDEDDEEIDF